MEKEILSWGEGEKGRSKRGEIFGGEKTEKEKEESSWRRKNKFRKIRKGGKHLEKKNVICEVEKKGRRKIFGERKYLYCGGEEKRSRKRRKISIYDCLIDNLTRCHILTFDFVLHPP